ncbi:hypothetical protein ACFGVR_11705 [Mucilaginibacter sp. AW1-3]
MKKLLLLLMFSLMISLKAYSQKIDSVYYLLDTSKIPKNANMWDIGIEHPFKYFTILCPCMQYGQNPTFLYKEDDPGQTITANQLKLIKQINLVNLIQTAKSFTDKGFSIKKNIFLIEANGRKYTMHRVGIVPPQKPRRSDGDYEIIPDYKPQKKP